MRAERPLRSPRKRSGVCALIIVSLLVGACSVVYSAHPGNARGQIQEVLGRYDGVWLGQPRSLALRRLGRTARSDDDPYADQANEPESLPADQPGVAVYRDVQLTFVRHRVASITVYGRGARTSRGVEIGDSLDRVRARYARTAPRLRCLPPEEGHAYQLTSRCLMKLGRHFLFFGGDPIAVIALSVAPFEG